jgi:hypothetical protein
MNYNGSCHCGQVKFTVEGEIDKVMECNCSICSTKGLLLWFVPRNQFQITTSDAELTTYEFYKHRIEHKFCPKCGVQAFAYSKDPKTGTEMAAINVRSLQGIDLATINKLPFDGRSM